MTSPKHFFAAVLSTLIWGFFSIPLRALKEFPSEQILYYRVFTSFLIVLIICIFFRRKSVQKDFHFMNNLEVKKRKILIWKTVGVSTLVTCNWFAFILVVNHVSLKAAAFAYMICPIITALSAYFILKEHLTKLKFFAMGIALISVGLLSVGFYKEVFYSIVVASLYAFYLIIQKGINGVNKFNFLVVQFAISTILILPFYFLNLTQIPSSPVFWYNIVLISVLFTIIPLFLSLYALEKIPSATIGITIYLNPIISFSIAFFYFNEKTNAQQLIAYFILFIAVVTFNWQTIKDLYLKRKMKTGPLIDEIIPQ